MPNDPACAGCVADDVGCVVYPASYNQSYCESTVLAAASSASGSNPGSFSGIWHAKARTEAQCAAHGCGCLKTGFGQGLLRYSFISNTASNASYCTQFGSECIPYFRWEKARWVSGTWRGIPQWITPKVYSTYNWTLQSLDWGRLARYIERIVQRLYGSLAVVDAQCRINRIAPALTAVACSCGDLSDSTCTAQSHNTDDVASVGTSCGGTFFFRLSCDRTSTKPPSINSS